MSLKFTALAVSLAATPALADGFATQNGGTTGGAGGNVVYATTGTQIHQALCNRASSDTPIIIQVEGTINHSNTSKVSGNSCNTAEDKIEIKEVSNITLLGVGNGALFDQLGIHIRDSSNIIIQNVHVRNVKKSGSPISNGGDAIGMEKDVSNVWVDHVTLEASGGESDGYDALFDMKNNTKYVTLSYSILRNSGRGGLVGSSDSDDNNGPVTFHHNYYENINSRTPLLRHATAHSYNNYYNGLISSGMNPRIGGRIRAENNYVQDSKDPLGTFYTNDMGYWQVSGNIWDNVVWSSPGDDSHPAGPNPSSTTTISIPYNYSLDNASCVPTIVSQTAGANTGLAVSNGSCGTTNNGIVNGTYKITPLHSGKTIDVENCGTENGTNVQQWGWLNNDCQKFNISSVDGIWHRISPVNAPNQALDVYNSSTSNGENIMLYEYWAGANQQFRFQSAGSGKWRIINRNSELCLDVLNASTDDGANLLQYECTAGFEHQMFTLERQ
ncbi:RICIN domain-containing protein [Vibrio sp. AK197]